MRDMLAATASTINCTNGVNGDGPTELTRQDIGEVTRALVNANAKMIMDGVEAEDKFGTAPVRDAFFAMANSNLTSDFNTIPGFISKNAYPNQTKTLRDEWGAVDNVRFLISSVGSITANASVLGADVYNIFVTGMESYANIEQDGLSAQFLYRPAQFSDPLMQNVSVGYKFASAQVLWNDKWIIKFCCTKA